MKDLFSEIETRSAIHHSTSKSDFVTPLFDQKESEQSYFVIDKFPGEFKKDILKSVDLRFALILIISFIFHIVTIFILEKEFPAQIDSKTIKGIQEQYVELFLDDKLVSPPSKNLFEAEPKIEPLDYETITGLTQWMDGFAENALESIKDMPAFSPEVPAAAEAPIQETKVPTKEAMNDVRQSAAKARIQSRADVEKKVSSIGLLGLISSKASRVDYEYIDDLLDYADLNEDHLERVLSKLSSIQVPHHNTAGYILSYKKSAAIRGGKLKGGRKYRNEDVRKTIENMAPLQSAKTTKIKRKTTLENIPTSDHLAKLRSNNLAGKKRSAKDVIRVVQSHKRALQDCYKQELKINPTVHGKIVIKFTVDPGGNVVKVVVASSTLNSRRMEKCIVRRIKNWRDFSYCDPLIGNITYKQVFNFGGN